MKIAVVQYDIVWENPAENLRRLEEWLDRYPGMDLYVLPEMFSTGFSMRPESLAGTSETLVLPWMRSMARRCGAAIAGSMMVEEGGKFFNRFHWVTPGGECVCYDKRHLFSFGGEGTCFSPGRRRVVVEYQGIRFLLMVCYDLRFPVWARNREDYDVAIYVANWPVARVEAWKTLLRARAIENQCYVIGANRVGADPSCCYSGESAVVDAYGRTMAAGRPGQEEVVVAELDLGRLQEFRRRFPVLKDTDGFVEE